MKKLFKNDWFRAISVLLILAVFLGGLLAILSDILYVSPDERTGRAIKKIYNEDKEYQTILDIDIYSEHKAIEFVQNEKVLGKINKIYIVGSDPNSYDMLFQSIGLEGYKGGSITVWTRVAVNKAQDKYSIENVLLESYDKQTLMSKLDGNYYSKFELEDVTDTYKKGEFFSLDSSKNNCNIVSGATYSSYAGINAVNAVIDYIGGLSNEG